MQFICDCHFSKYRKSKYRKSEVNEVHLYSAFVIHSKGLYNTVTHSHTHLHTDGGGCHARCRPAQQEWLGVQCLA